MFVDKIPLMSQSVHISNYFFKSFRKKVLNIQKDLMNNCFRFHIPLWCIISYFSFCMKSHRKNIITTPASLEVIVYCQKHPLTRFNGEALYC